MRDFYVLARARGGITRINYTRPCQLGLLRAKVISCQYIYIYIYIYIYAVLEWRRECRMCGFRMRIER